MRRWLLPVPLSPIRHSDCPLHIVHVTQARCHPEARAYLTRRAAENKTKRAARRAHKRQLANVIIRRMWSDADSLARANSTASSAVA